MLNFELVGEVDVVPFTEVNLLSDGEGQIGSLMLNKDLVCSPHRHLVIQGNGVTDVWHALSRSNPGVQSLKAEANEN